MLLTLLLMLAPAGIAEEAVSLCGTYRDRWREELHLHRRSEQNRRGRGGGIGLAAAEGAPRRPATKVSGDVVLMEDGDGVVSRRNAFDLDRKSITFNPSAAAGRYRFAIGGNTYDAGVAQAGTLIEDFGDDDSREFTLPFPFPFYGETYTSIHVNSDGHLTFLEADTSTDPRSLDRVTSGPPRIAPLFRDLDPTQADDGVRVLLEGGRVVVSWSRVPVFSSFGQGALQTFQARLFPDGRVEFAYDGIDVSSAVVAISPGGLKGTTRVVTFSEGSSDEFDGAIAERFTQKEELDVIVAGQKFFEEFEDAYDYLVFYNNMGLEADVGTVAFEISVRSRVAGIGDFLVDFGKLLGSQRRLQAFLNMGPLRQYPEDPRGIVPRRAIAGDTPLSVLGHEAGHLFLAFASVRNPLDPEDRPMLTLDRAHWRFTFNAEASLMSGNRICDHEREACAGAPQGTRFVTTDTVSEYSPLDQYLMGLRAPRDVPDTFLVENPSIFAINRFPQKGVGFDGDRRDIRVEEIIAVEGRRTPDYTVAQRRFRFAFVLVHESGKEPSAADIAKLDRFRTEFEGFFNDAADGRAVAVTSLRRSLSLSAFPAAGVLLGATATATFEIAGPREGDLDLLLTSKNGDAGIPASVTIPAGKTSASFNVQGLREGVDVITAEAPGGEYETARARVQVLGAIASLRLVADSGHRQLAVPGQPLPEPVVVRATDSNNLPYPGVTLLATPSGGGSVSPASAMTGADGRAAFRWTPGAATGETLRVGVAGVFGGPTITVTTSGLPRFPAAGVVHGATFAPQLAPGTLASVFGQNLAAGVTEFASLPLPEELSGVSVLVNGAPAPLLYISDPQINFQIPLDTAAGKALVEIITPLGRTGAVEVTISPQAPGIFLADASGQGAVLAAGTGRLTSERPAAPGEFLEVFATGLGAVRRDTETGLQVTTSVPEVTIGGIPAEVDFSGLAPGFAGLYQINVRVPAGAAAGQQTLSLTIDGIASNDVWIVIR